LRCAIDLIRKKVELKVVGFGMAGSMKRHPSLIIALPAVTVSIIFNA